jgi:hypothetical protein
MLGAGAPGGQSSSESPSPKVLPTMIDENAFGLLVSYYSVEDDEYSLEREQFAERVRTFRDALNECLQELPLGEGVRALDLGHALYLEVGDGEETEDPFGWVRMARARLSAKDFLTVGVLSHGSRWVESDGCGSVQIENVGEVSVCRASWPSEALRRALYADAAARRDEDCPGWGPGLYVDAEAIDAMGRKLRNAPTPLHASCATYYRFGA